MGQMNIDNTGIKEALLASGSEELDSLLVFTAEIDKMTGVSRRTLLLDRSRRENDAEHSWHIAVMSAIFSDFAREPVDTDRAVRMCLVHDLVEIYAGDTFAYDRAGYADKAAREAAAADRVFSMLPGGRGDELRALWEEFDAMETPDAKYAACMDRLQPFLHNTLTDGHTWVEGHVSRSQVEARMAVIKDFMPLLWPWILENIEKGIEKGWIAADPAASEGNKKTI